MMGDATPEIARVSVMRLANRMERLRKPVNDLSRGTTVADIVTTVAVTAAQVRDNEPGLAGVAEHFWDSSGPVLRARTHGQGAANR
ncbi:hypothetical protein [Nonomuraea rubra]|uniref:hypothetical protein n=1 Tax=Nonomuraea rubra TaxID=46180 RepID=UPI00340312B3